MRPLCRACSNPTSEGLFLDQTSCFRLHSNFKPSPSIPSLFQDSYFSSHRLYLRTSTFRSSVASKRLLTSAVTRPHSVSPIHYCTLLSSQSTPYTLSKFVACLYLLSSLIFQGVLPPLDPHLSLKIRLRMRLNHVVSLGFVWTRRLRVAWLTSSPLV